MALYDELKFDPHAGTVVRDIDEHFPGSWVGAPGVFYDTGKKLFYLTYRYHSLKCFQNSSITKRGYLAKIAASSDGINFTDIKEFRIADFNSSSLSRAALTKTADGKYHYLIAYDKMDATQWIIGIITGHSVEELNASDLKPVFQQNAIMGASLRDPYLLHHNGRCYMLVCIERLHWKPDDEKINPHDRFEGMTCTRSTGLASVDNNFKAKWHGEILAIPSEGWDSTFRIVRSLWFDGEKFTGYYDGNLGDGFNHEDYSGIVDGTDLKNLKPLSPEPFIKSCEGSGSVQSIDRITVEGKTYIYYECSKPDNSHNLRVMVK